MIVMMMMMVMVVRMMTMTIMIMIIIAIIMIMMIAMVLMIKKTFLITVNRSEIVLLDLIILQQKVDKVTKSGKRRHFMIVSDHHKV